MCATNSAVPCETGLILSILPRTGQGWDVNPSITQDRPSARRGAKPGLDGAICQFLPAHRAACSRPVGPPAKRQPSPAGLGRQPRIVRAP